MALALRRCVMLAAALALAACQLGPKNADAAAGPQAVAGDGAAPDMRIGALSSRDLGAGECGLFLWTRTAPPALVFFADPQNGSAAIVLDDRELALRRLSVEAAEPGGRAGAQTFATASGDVSVRLSVIVTESVSGGYRVGSASLRITDASGWSGLVPAAGLAACQP